MDLDHDLGLGELATERSVLSLQFIESMELALSLLSPFRFDPVSIARIEESLRSLDSEVAERRGVETFASKKRSDFAGLLAAVGFVQYPALIVERVSSPGFLTGDFGGEFGVRAIFQTPLARGIRKIGLVRIREIGGEDNSEPTPGNDHSMTS